MPPNHMRFTERTDSPWSVLSNRGSRMVRRTVGAVDPLWVGFLAFMIIVKLLLDVFFPNGIADPSQRSFFEWSSIAVIWIFGLVGVTLARRADFPAPLSQAVPARAVSPGPSSPRGTSMPYIIHSSSRATWE